MPFLEMAKARGKILNHGPIFVFRLPSVHSLSTSGHKWIGAPFPTGITTLAGSRSGLAPIVLCYCLASHSHAVQIERARRCQDLASYTHAKLLELSHRLAKALWVQRKPLSLAVLLRRPNGKIVHSETMRIST